MRMRLKLFPHDWSVIIDNSTIIRTTEEFPLSLSRLLSKFPAACVIFDKMSKVHSWVKEENQFTWDNAWIVIQDTTEPRETRNVRRENDKKLFDYWQIVICNVLVCK